MADLNKVFLIGRLTQDPDLRWTAGGAAVTDIRLATSRSWTSKDGERKEETLFIDVTVWNRQAENCCQYLRKGRLVHVEGYLKSESWETSTGEKRNKVKVEAERVQFLERRDEAAAGAPGVGSPPHDDDEFAPPPPREQRRSAPAAEYPARPAASSPSNGRQGSGYAPPAAAPQRRPAPPPPPSDLDESDEEDIPF